MKQPKGKKPDPKTDKNAKGKNDKPEEEEPQPVPVEKPKTLERFIYVTTYSDSAAMEKIKEVFEEINQPAFSLKSVKEIYTRDLTDEERDNNEIDYISGVQLIDKDLRITIIEGVSGKGMAKVKEKLPKYQMNTKTFKVFADSKILFNKRIYSKFNLSLKYIKLRDTLAHILGTYDIYLKANKYRDIYNAFLNFGSILKSETMQEISEANLFPDADSLLLLERKYADILIEEDMTGVHQQKKAKQRVTADSIIDKANFNNTVYSHLTDIGIPSIKSKTASAKAREEEEEKKRLEEEERARKAKEVTFGHEYDNIPKTLKPKLDSHNYAYDEFLMQEKPKLTPKEYAARVQEELRTMKKKPNPDGRFCRPFPEKEENEYYAKLFEDWKQKFNGEVYVHSPNWNNYYDQLVDYWRQKFIEDKKHYYSYSKAALTLSFPLGTTKNQKYLDYLENKRKWKNKNDFDRYKQYHYFGPSGKTKEYVYFPKINNVL